MNPFTFFWAKRRVGLVLVPLASLALLLFGDLDPEHPEVTRMAAVAILMAGWWITEAIPIPATALLPVVLFPFLGILSGKGTASLYFNHVIFLFIGGFIFALAMEKWDLHRRIALRIILAVGTGPRRMLLGFMLSSWFLSMWISNTATTMMMMPMAIAIIAQLWEVFGKEHVGRYAVGLLLGIAYAASIGGLATLIGTPPNIVLVQILDTSFPGAPAIGFSTWFFFALPLSVAFLLVTWLLIFRLFGPAKGAMKAQASVFRREYAKLGRITYEEVVILVLFVFLVALWMFRKPIQIGDFSLGGWSKWAPVPDFIDDGTVAIGIALLLFLIPARRGVGRLMDWKTANRVNWGIVLLFGGGFALAAGFMESGLSVWLTHRLTALGDLPPVVLVLATCTLITFLTELTSNTATTQMVLPILASLAIAIGVNPLLLMIPATLSASCAFMLPVATPPNAIVFGTGEIRMADMIRGGLVLNLVGIVLITLTIYTLGEAVLGIDLLSVPSWAAGGG
ncbi:MAG: DASS family sodium-coupled anion symporter [Planctomycetota bacterium]